MASKQECVSDWMSLARAYDKVERDQQVIPYVVVCLENRRTHEVLYRYDLPRDLFWRRHWVIDWRAAKLLCKYPKDGINQILDFYDKNSGLSYGFGSLLSQLTSAKAQVTIASNKLRDYVESQQGNMFFDVNNDVLVLKFKAKISSYKQKVYSLENSIKFKVSNLKSI